MERFGILPPRLTAFAWGQDDGRRRIGDGAFDGDGVLSLRLALVLGGEAAEEVELVAGEEADLDPAEDVVHDRLGVADLLVAGPAGGLEAGVDELFAETGQRPAVLEGALDGV